MSTILVFLLTLAQTVAIAAAFAVPIKPLFDALLVYGSPMFFIMNLLGQESVAVEVNPIFPLIAGFHIVKYILLARSQFGGDHRSLHILAVILEVGYLVLCGYYL